MHPFIIDAQATCLLTWARPPTPAKSRTHAEIAGQQPCTRRDPRRHLEYDANKQASILPPGALCHRIRNGEGFGIDADGRLFVTNTAVTTSPELARLYKPKDGPELPAEEVMQLQSGADYGWPECYFRRVSAEAGPAPEYGGARGQDIRLCAQRSPPAAFFPAHWAPNDLLL